MIEKFAAAKMSLFGAKSISAISEYLLRENLKRAFIVTDTSIRRLGLLEPVTTMLENEGIEYLIYDRVQPNPTIKNVTDGVAIMREKACDMIIAVGGGSANDCAKAIRVLEANGGCVQDYIGVNKSKTKGKFLVAINTTAGTASEVSRAYLISDEENEVKLICKDDYAMPDLAVNDVELMLGLPKSVTAQTGMDALTHAIESYLCKNSTLLTGNLAKEAAYLVYKNLEKVLSNPQKLELREKMALGQYLAGLSFGSAGLGLVHAMAHQVGAKYHLPHGLCNAILLPVVLEYYLSECEKEMAELADWLFGGKDTHMSKYEKAKAFIAEIYDLSARVKTKVPLKELGVKDQDLPLLADKALQDGCILASPKMPSKNEIIELYKKAM